MVVLCQRELIANQHFIVNVKAMKGSMREKIDNLRLSSHLYNLQVHTFMALLCVCVCVLTKLFSFYSGLKSEFFHHPDNIPEDHLFLI